MIPLRLKITGFLSYRDPVEIDFSTFNLACISGENGAGKSSLLDSITWALFGQARKRDDTLINTYCENAEVIYSFEYEQDIYRIQRTMLRGKTGMLEFQVRNKDHFHVLTESTSRATQAKIEQTLRLDYDTFVNASFFLQGKADLFTQQRPTDRKRILASILGLELWETYRERTANRRKIIETDLSVLDGRLAEINAELAEEPGRKLRLKELENELVRLVEMRKAQELILVGIKQSQEGLKRQQEAVQKLSAQIGRFSADLNTLMTRQSSRAYERNKYLEIAAQHDLVQSKYNEWVLIRSNLENWEKLAEQFREQEKDRLEPLSKISAEKARLEQEFSGLLQQEREYQARESQLMVLQNDFKQAQEELVKLEKKAKVQAELDQLQVIISRFREQAQRRQPPLTEISAEKARLEQEVRTLERQNEVIDVQRAAFKKLENELTESKDKLARSENQLNQKKTLELQAQRTKEEQLVLKSSNDRLKLEMETLDERIKKLEVAEGALCPLCGQPLNPTERQELIGRLRNEGKEKGDEFRKNKVNFEALQKELITREKEISGFGRVEQDHLYHVSNISMITERMQANQQTILDWETNGEIRLQELRESLLQEKYSIQARQHLARIDRELDAIAQAMGVKLITGKSIFQTVEEKVFEIETELRSLQGLNEERMRYNTRVTQLGSEITAIKASAMDWIQTGQPRLTQITHILETSNYAIAERAQLAEIDVQLMSLGYDVETHENLRRSELAGRNAEHELREVEGARSALVPLEREINDIQTQIDTLNNEIQHLSTSLEAEQTSLENLKATTPDLLTAEKALLDAQERENILTRDVGAAQQKVRVLQDLRTRKGNLESQREDYANQIKNHKTLERAFGKDGVPALLIEQALPQIEEKSNEILERLSNSTMSVRFVTQAGYKDKKREDLKETLEILISDGAGTRDYEMFSGGEAFRVNFAIRLALSEILARRTGAKLQTLVIDEGFGSQDAIGRQRLIEAINHVKADFAKILIITHLDELKEAFPNRIEVEKTPRGSTIRVM